MANRRSTKSSGASPTEEQPVRHIPVSLSQRVLRTDKPPIAQLMHQGVLNPNLISLAAGLVDQESLPTESVAAAAKLLAEKDRGRAALQYGTTNGDRRLREQIVEHLCGLEGVSPEVLGVTPDRVVIGTGSQQLLYLVGELLLDPGDIVLAGVPGYFVYMGALESLGARIMPIATDNDGIIPQAVDDMLAQLESHGELHHIKFLYDVSYFNNPTGLCLSWDRRSELIAVVQSWSQCHRICIVEDAAYRELRYDGVDLPSVFSLDSTGQSVLYAGTFSKSFSPGLKTGFLVAPPELVEPLVHQKGHHDFGSSNFNQQILADVLQSGEYRRHVAALCAIYRAKRDCMLETLAGELVGLESEVLWTRPEGGLYVWVRLPDGFATGPDSDFFAACIERGVLVVPGEYCYPSAMPAIPRHHVRLSFGVQPPDRIREGTRRFCDVVRGLLACR